MRGRWRQRRSAGEDDLNITAFMNLMVILVPFLLITAAFSHTAIMQLSLPEAAASDAPSPVTKRPVRLEVIVRGDAIEVGDRAGGRLRRFETGPRGYDLAALNAFLIELKRRFPRTRDITLLAEPEIPYQVLVNVMDSVRQTGSENGRRAELFPGIAIGDAPPVTMKRKKG